MSKRRLIPHRRISMPKGQSTARRQPEILWTGAGVGVTDADEEELADDAFRRSVLAETTRCAKRKKQGEPTRG